MSFENKIMISEVTGKKYSSTAMVSEMKIAPEAHGNA